MLVGREAERRVIGRLLAGSRAGSGGALVVVGEPGIGKSALLEEAEGLAGDMTLLRARGAETEQDIPFAGLLQLLRPILDVRSRLPTPQAEALAQAFAMLPGRPAERFAVYAATLGLICRAAEDQPLVAVVDDLHAMDRPSVEAVLFAARRLGTDSVAVLLGSRPLDSPGLTAGITELRLGGLAPEATRHLVAHRGLTEGQMSRLLEVTAGNPLAALEMSSSQDRLVADGVEHLPVPGLLAEAFGARLAGLDEASRAVLLVAAAGALDRPDLLGACARLGLDADRVGTAERAGLVRLTRERVEFLHPLVRAVSYQSAEPEERRAAHAAIAETVGESRLDRYAWHLAEAATGPDDAVADRLEQAAEASTARGAHAVAARSLERAARLSTDTGRRAERLVSAGEAAWFAGLTEQAVPLLDEAARLTTDPEVRIREMALRGIVAARSGSLSEATSLLASAAARRAADDPDEAVLLMAEAIYAALYLCDVPRALSVAGQIEAVAERLTSPWARGLAATATGVALIIAGRGGEGAERIREGVPARGSPAGSEDDPRWLPWQVLAPIWLRDSGDARRLIDEVVASARDRVALGALPFLLFHLARDDATTNRWAAAEGSFLEAIRLAAETGHRTDEGAARAGLAWLLARQGRESETRECVAAAAGICEPSRINFGRAWLLFAQGDLELGLGRTEQATEHYLALQRLLEELSVVDPDLSPVPELVECWGRAGTPEPALATAEAFHRSASAKGQPWALARAHRALALAGADPAGNFEEALRLHAATPDAFERARSRLAYGAWLRRERQRSEARAPLRAALETFESLGADPWAATAAAELAATGERVRRRVTGADRQLTPQELQIATLLAEGRTTREAAAAVFLSPKTVEYHLRHVYLKLGIGSRAELVERWAADPELRPRPVGPVGDDPPGETGQADP
ncbi:ATP-binding protein [Nocardioides donggukensis]|uniref:AAA family ATPase n=1 Tax=Nocardioides donggukensis TaxID=2774019 RepID=A0A927Q002_9ACTN|nr:helix-turn-helix transcriptional regulator [Nocardioides donggukensis]MBD8869985.1 AAA family ATPase [Nocardioides donggukensis]